MLLCWINAPGWASLSLPWGSTRDSSHSGRVARAQATSSSRAGTLLSSRSGIDFAECRPRGLRQKSNKAKWAYSIADPFKTHRNVWALWVRGWPRNNLHPHSSTSLHVSASSSWSNTQRCSCSLKARWTIRKRMGKLCSNKTLFTKRGSGARLGPRTLISWLVISGHTPFLLGTFPVLKHLARIPVRQIIS